MKFSANRSVSDSTSSLPDIDDYMNLVPDTSSQSSETSSFSSSANSNPRPSSPVQPDSQAIKKMIGPEESLDKPANISLGGHPSDDFSGISCASSAGESDMSGISCASSARESDMSGISCAPSMEESDISDISCESY